MKKSDSAITWVQFHNWVPIITSVVLIASSFFMIQTRLALIEQKVELIAQGQKTMIEIFKDIETRYGQLSLKVERHDVLLK